MSGHLAAIEPSLVPPLFEPGPLAGVRRLADALPACSAAGFECRLSEEARLDFHAFFSPSHISAFDGCGSGPEWQAIRRHAAECNTAGTLLAERVMNYVLEFDMDAPPEVVRPPSFFIALKPPHPPCTGADAVLASIAPQVDPQVSAAVAECLRLLPPGAYVNHVGLMLSRPDGAVRLNLIMEPQEIAGYLTAIGWMGSVAAVAALAGEFEPLTKSFDLAVDVSRTGPRRKIGFECFAGNAQPILDVLVNRRLSTSAKARALQRWPGTQQPQTSTHWPANISAADRFLGADVISFFLRRVNHLKVVFEDGHLTEAKAYLLFGHQWVDRRSHASAVELRTRLRRRTMSFSRLAEETVAPADPTDPEDPLPFEEILLPAIRRARRAVNADWSLLSQRADRQLQRGLLIDLTNLCAPAFEAEFDQFRPAGVRFLAQLQGTAAANCPRTYYDGFVGGFSDSGRGGEMAALFARWPVLANLLDRVVTFWVESTGEFLNRVRDDMELLDEASRVTFIRTHLSDRHRNGRTVLAVEFESGRWWIYKPRTLAMEAAYFDLLSWCNQQQELPWSFQMLRVLNRGDYGWMEFAAPSPCEDAAEVSRFYERAGALLALLYVLRGTDCHCENIIAAGEHPVLIDAEALFHPEMKPAAMGEAPEAPQLAGQLLDDSVLRTGLLPRWEVSAASGTARDVSALGAGAGGPDSVQVERWTAVNTDHMHRALQDRLRVPPFHLPVLPGCAISPDDYVPKLIDGFAAMYRFLARRGEDAFARFQGLPMRYLFRWTALYQTVTARSISLASLRDPAEREKEVALLARLFEAGDAHPESRRILETERAAIERLDIPYFQGSTSGTALMDETGAIVIADVFEKPPHQDALERWRRMSDEDEALQVKFIAGSFQARQAQNAPRSDSGRGATPEELAREELPGRATLLQQAEEISRELAARAWRNSDGSVNWIGLLQAENSQQYQLSPLSARLYDGSSGIALFLAALHNTTGSLESAELAQAALSPLRDFLRSTSKGSRARFLRYLGIGGGTGVGSMIYSLVKISGLLKDSPGFLPEATLLAQHIDDDALRADRQLDVIGGAAGALLGLLTLHSATNDSDALDRAVRCGNVLLEKRVSVKGTFKAWITTETEPLTGFAHGAAGIAYALLRLYAACGQRKFFQAAEEAVAYEQSTFNSDLNNWPTWKKGAVPWYMVNWCHGATGIGLGRLGGLPWMDSPEIRQEIDAALATTQNWGAQDVDHLCCGNAGRVELFLKAGRRDDALRLLGWVLRRARIAGGYRIFPNFRDHVFSPGFFQGTAGIGYTLLRAATDASLPSVLLWD